MHPFELYYNSNSSPNVQLSQGNRRPSEPTFNQQNDPPRRPSVPVFGRPDYSQQLNFTNNANRRRPSLSNSHHDIDDLSETIVSVQPYVEQSSYPRILQPTTPSSPLHPLPPLPSPSPTPQVPSSPPPPPGTQEHHDESNRIYEVFRRLLSRDWTLGRRNNSHQTQPGGDQHRPLMSPNSTSTQDSVTSSSKCYCYSVLIIFIVIVSLGSAAISGYLLYAHFQEPECAAGDSHRSPSSLPLTADSDSLSADRATASAHIRIEKDSDPKSLRLVRGESGVGNRTHTANVRPFEYGLCIVQNGTYYVYFSISVDRKTSASPGTIYAGLNYIDGSGRNEILFRAEHTWCKECSIEKATLYSGGVYKLRQGARLFVEVTNPDDVSEYSFLGLFRI